jgi:PAS domain S-box-containing protein
MDDIEVEVPIRVVTAGEPPIEPAEATDQTNTISLLRVLRASACIVLMFQAIYLAADWGWSAARHEAILPLHFFNFLTALIFLALTYLRAYQKRMPQVILGGCTLLFAATTALSILSLDCAPLTITVTLTMMGAAALMPWDWRWQAGLAVAGGASMAAFTLLRPGSDLHLGYDWLALVTAAGIAHYATLSGERYRREIARRIIALQIKHHQFLAERTEREAVAGASERVHRQLGESEAKLRKIFETCSDAITVSRLSDGCYLDVNEAFSVTGYSRQEALAGSAGSLGVWADRAQLREFLKTLRTTGSVVNMEFALRAKDGEVAPFLISAKVIELDGQECVVTIGRNIRAIKQAEADLILAREVMRGQIETLERTEERLRTEILERSRAMEERGVALRELADSEGKLRRIFELSPDSISIARMADGEIIAVNESLCAMTGLTSDELIGRKADETGIWADADLTEFMRLLRIDGRIRDMDAVLRHRSGRLIPHIISSVVAELGGELCAISIAHDITERKRTETELLAAREAALTASQAKSEFLSSMSHEIRTPMNAILGMAQLLEESPLNADQKKYLEIMSNNGDALLDLIDGILDLARIESGRLSLEQSGFDLETLVDRTVETLGVRAHQKGLEMLAHVMPDVPLRLVGDRLRIRQVLLNLVGNAVKFTDRGQVLLTVERDRESAVPGHLHFSVADTGIGIPEDKLQEVFSSFTQADSSTTRQYGGSGLGLAIVRRLVDLMGGCVWVESELGRGSVFHFTVHLQVQTDAPVEKQPTVTVMLSGVRALVVDDNFTNRLILREMLSSRGAEVTEVEDGPAALEHIERARANGIPYKLMLLDCRMPGMDGFQVAERLKAGAEHGLTVLMLSSDDLKVQITRARELGLDAYLVKPVRRADLFEAIATAMANHAADSDAGVMEPEQTAALASTPGTAPNLQPDLPLSILLADDSKDNRLLIHAYLKNTAYRLDDAENGAIAVAKLKAGNYDLVLMDIQMPVMDGLEATRAIRDWEQERGLSRTPILALTASALDEDVRRTREAGVDMHVSKPIKKGVLLAAIKNSVRAPSALTILKSPNDAAA